MLTLIFLHSKINSFASSDGRLAVFPPLLQGEEYFNDKESLTLRREEGHYRLYDPDTQYAYLLYPSEKGYMQYKLNTIENGQGHTISVSYDSNGYLSKITDSAGRELCVQTNAAGRITAVTLENQALVTYRYNDGQDLTEAIDAAGLSVTMNYRDHLMLHRTNRDKHTFYWKYDGPTTGARVTETWGNGRVLYGKFTYHDSERYNTLTDSLGNATQYHYDDRNLCIKTVYADYTETRRVYNEQYQLIQEINEEGRPTLYQYGKNAQLTQVTMPDGAKTKLEYDGAGRLIKAINPEGAANSRIYNEDGTLQAYINELGIKTTYAYNENKLLEAITNAKGDTIRLYYDKDHNLSQVTLPDGSSSRWEYDSRGNCISAQNPLGATDRYQYDALNRLVRTSLADGNEIELKYNGYDDIIHAKDKQTEVSFAYTVLGNLKSRTQADRHVEFEYDTEEQLIKVTNERGEEYKFERDLKGNISKETTYDGIVRTYERGQSGLLKKVNRPGGRYTAYRHDKAGRVTSIDYSDKTWDQFAYNKNGELTEAENENIKLIFERNALGQITKEWQNGHWVASEYDELGSRTKVSSSLGANILMSRDRMGNATHMAAAQAGSKAWAAQTQYNELGQEIERLLPGNIIDKRQYDVMGRAQSHTVRNDGKDSRRRTYEWGINSQLKQVTNELTRCQTTYGYDEFANLVSSQNSEDWKFIYRSSDKAGNIYETKDRTDRIYGIGNRLEQTGVNTNELKNEFQGGKGRLVTKGTEYSYDVEGNLAKKTELNGDTWQYEYYGNGMMSKVIKPKGEEVTFKYDAFGRRIEKQTAEKTTNFLWDGNTPLNEVENNSNITTWVFDDGFTPKAKLTKEGNYSIISDYLGTPVEAYDKDGEKVWSASLDIYGRVKENTGKEGFIPFRYQGQYYDEETGLYYNRYRYYDPITGQYTQQDPIGLEGNNPTLYGYVGNTNVWVDIFGLWSLYRAIFADEINDILTNNVVKNVPWGYETGKLFATTSDDAVKFGEKLSRFEKDPNFKILEVDVPNNINVTEFNADSMKAVSVDNADLSKLKIKGCR